MAVDEKLQPLYECILQKIVKHLEGNNASTPSVYITIRNTTHIEYFFSKNISLIRDDLNTLLEQEISNKKVRIQKIFNPADGELAYWNCCMSPMVEKSVFCCIYCPCFFIPKMLYQCFCGTKLQLYVLLERM
jgi:hypothetical protein